ncbi:hypothetical protein JG687_00006476 [Phytophthora cactorum]|uniref:Uncharacterized protein n=1 Tax=Phytophthora cactorum TaxID=29920 RepID=A0A8T1UHX0_9STRA|nr:hypothetical protein JG687_00006476 [Phytophthora cactorum]
MRQTKGLCVTMKCIILMIGKFDVEFSASRTHCALLSWTARFLKRNNIVVRRITHKGTKRRADMQEIADVLCRTMHVEVEGDGFFPVIFFSVRSIWKSFQHGSDRCLHRQHWSLDD